MLDQYCERVSAGLWAEPLNLLTNAAFVVVALAAWRLARRHRRLGWRTKTLLAAVALTGIGSALFHSVATPWARTLDLAPAVAFQLWFLWLYLRHIVEWRPSGAIAAVVAVLAAISIAGQFSRTLNGSLIYAPTLLVLWGIGAHHAAAVAERRHALVAAAAVFTVSLALRTVDNAVCPAVPIGTHWLWHLLNAVAMYLALAALLRARRLDAPHP